MSKLLVVIAALAGCCVGGMPLLAIAADYRVDLIVVINRQASAEMAAAVRTAVKPKDNRAIDLSDKTGLRRAGISLLPTKTVQFALETEWQKLRRSRFKPVARLAWTQTPKQTATALRLHDDFRYQLVQTPAAQVDPLADPLIVPAPTPAVGQAAVELYRLEGALLLQQSAGLRVSFDLNYSLPVNAVPADYPPTTGKPVTINATELVTVSLHGEKRVNLGQNYFFDHPVLGLLLRVTQPN